VKLLLRYLLHSRLLLRPRIPALYRAGWHRFGYISQSRSLCLALTAWTRRFASLFSTITQKTLAPQDYFAPRLATIDVFANDSAEGFHPGLLVSGIVGVEVNCLAIGESDAEAFFNEHVRLVFVGECRLATTFSTLTVASIGLEERRFVVDELRSFGERDVGSWLSCGFMVGCELQAG
jgi:hypothetical protein